MTPIERRIFAGVLKCKAQGLDPKSVYLTPADLAELEKVGPIDAVAGLAIKRVSGKGKSRIYCRHGIAVHVPKAAPALARGARR